MYYIKENEEIELMRSRDHMTHFVYNGEPKMSKVLLPCKRFLNGRTEFRSRPISYIKGNLELEQFRR